MYDISVCFSSDSNYVRHMAAAMASILKNKKSDEFIKFYIIDGGITDTDRENLHFFEEHYDCWICYVKPDLNKLKNCITFKGDYISLATYYRLLIPEIVPEDRVIYLDCDIIVRKSLRPLFEKDFRGNLVLGVEDVSYEAHSKRLNLSKYVNAGAILLNNKALREGNYVSIMFNWMAENKDKIECHDQDIINASLEGKVDYLEDEYGAQVKYNGKNRFEKIKDPSVLHFISPQKPWILWKPINYTHWEDEYYNAIKNTPFDEMANDYKLKSKIIFPFRIFYPSGFVKDFIRQIFSIRNTDDRSHKVITILGFKIKYKKEKQIKEKIEKKLLCHLHLHYTEQIDYYIEKLKNIEGIKWDLYVTLTKENDDIKKKILNFKDDAKVYVTESRGYDVWPFIELIKNINLDEYSYVIKLHSKGPDSKGSYKWRNKLVDAILKDKKRFKRNLKILNKNTNIGMIASSKWFINAEGPEPENNKILEDELRRIGFKTNERHFVAGTIFILKANVLNFLKTDKINKEMFEIGGKSHSQGTYAHVYERIITYSVFESGFKVHRIFDGFITNKIFQWVFSLKNTYDKRHKKITILGIKIKIKRKNKKEG